MQSKKSPATVAKEIAKEAENYNGFNLILADLRANVMVYVSNRPQGEAAAVQIVPPGLHVLSNAKLDSPWPKVGLELRMSHHLSDRILHTFKFNRVFPLE